MQARLPGDLVRTVLTYLPGHIAIALNIDEASQITKIKINNSNIWLTLLKRDFGLTATPAQARTHYLLAQHAVNNTNQLIQHLANAPTGYLNLNTVDKADGHLPGADCYLFWPSTDYITSDDLIPLPAKISIRWLVWLIFDAHISDTRITHERQMAASSTRNNYIKGMLKSRRTDSAAKAVPTLTIGNHGAKVIVSKKSEKPKPVGLHLMTLAEKMQLFGLLESQDATVYQVMMGLK